MREVIHVLDVPFDTLTLEQAKDKVMSFLNEKGQHIICTPNPEIVMEAQKDTELMNILKAADLVVPDGIGVVWASKYSEKQLTERVAGYDLVQKIFDEIKDTEHTIYFLGGAPGVSLAAAKKMQQKYPNLKIVGGHNGYFDEKEEKHIINDIKKLSPSILLVGLGAPKQEKWIYDNIRLTDVKVAIGVGGSFDVMSGKSKRAPKLFCQLGLEWFYRLLCQPSRIGRMMNLPKFAITVLKNRHYK